MVLPFSRSRSSSNMDDLLIRVEDFDPQQGGYPVQVILEAARTFNSTLRLDGLTVVQGGNPREIIDYGLDLFTRLFPSPLDDAFQQALAAAQARERGLRVRLWLDAADPLLHEIPWELLHYDASGGMARPIPIATDDRIAFSRYLSSTEPWNEPIESRPLRVLLIISAPVDLGTAAWPDLVYLERAEEEREFRSRLIPLQHAGQLKLSVLNPASPDNLHRALDADNDIIIYFGHALHHRQRGTRLVLEDPQSRTALLYDSDELVRRLQQARPRPSLLILIACNTAAQQIFPRPPDGVQTTAPASLAARLVQQSGIPAVLAMQNLLDLSLARIFSYQLGEYLLRNGIVDVAVERVRQRIYRPESIEWSTPVLYMRSRDGRLFAPNARLEYVQRIIDNPDFSRWQKPDFINREAIIIPYGQPWHLFEQRPADAPPGLDVLVALNRELLLDAADTPRNIVALIGPPRSGQTTTLQRVTFDIAMFARSALAQAPIAILVSLAGYEQQRGSNRLQEMILETVQQQVPALANDLRRLFQHTPLAPPPAPPRYIFVLDGLDAIPDPDRIEAAQQIATLARRLPRERILVSSTRDMFPGTILMQASVVMMLPLGERQVLRYLRQRLPDSSGRVYRQILENGLLDLTTDPTMLTFVLERLSNTGGTEISRSQLLQDLLEQTIGNLPDLFQHGNVARRTFMTLAWEFRWQYANTLHVNAVFALMDGVRRERDYSLEAMFRLFLTNRLLAAVGQYRVRFVYPALQAYAAALALRDRPDFQERLNDIIALCGVSSRLAWWEEVVYALAGALDDPTPLAPLVDIAVRDQNSTHALLVARALRALSEPATRQLTEANKLTYIDICVARLNPEREPLMERRAQIATALGRLRHPTVFEELNRLLITRILPVAGHLDYDHPRVRLAAARALRGLTAQIPLSSIIGLTADADVPWHVYEHDSPATAPTATPANGSSPPDVPLQRLDSDTMPRRTEDPHWYAPSLAVLDARLIPILLAWNQALDGTPEIARLGQQALQRAIVSSQLAALERSIAALALGDVAMSDSDADLLLHTIIQTPPLDVPEPEWQAALHAIADALTMFDNEVVSGLLLPLFATHEQQHDPSIPAHATNAISYAAGRLRMSDPAVLRWLLLLLRDNPSLLIKASAIQSLGWIGTSQASLDWLDPVLADTRLPYPDEMDTTTVIRTAMEDVALWDTSRLDLLPSFGTLHPANPDVRRGTTPHALYLRCAALQALALAGNPDTLTRINRQAADWPLALRREWHTAAQDIRERVRQVLTSRVITDLESYRV